MSFLFEHLVDHFGLESLSDLQQLVHVLPINLASVVDELLIVFQICLVTEEQIFDVIIFESETKLQGQEIVSYKCHQQDQIINDFLNS